MKKLKNILSKLNEDSRNKVVDKYNDQILLGDGKWYHKRIFPNFDSLKVGDHVDFYQNKTKKIEKNIAEAERLAKDYFGTTEDVQKAGYILTDGTMLDFSGGGNTRLLDHNDISSAFYDENDEELIDMSRDEFIGGGAIRVFPESEALQIDKAPTTNQYKTIANTIEGFFFERINIECTSDGKRFYKEYEMPYPNKVTSDIMNFYAGHLGVS